MDKNKEIFGKNGILILSLIVVSMIFIGALVVSGQSQPSVSWNEPTLPPPQDNPPPPIHAGGDYQQKQGLLEAQDFFSTNERIWVATLLKVPKRYHLEISSDGTKCEILQGANEEIDCSVPGTGSTVFKRSPLEFALSALIKVARAVVSSDDGINPPPPPSGSGGSGIRKATAISDTAYDFCQDLDGCEVIIGRRTYDANGLIKTEGKALPRLFISSDGSWDSILDQGDTSGKTSGRDGNSNSQRIVGIDDSGGSTRCLLNDEEVSGLGQDTGRGFSFWLFGGGQVCFLDILD